MSRHKAATSERQLLADFCLSPLPAMGLGTGNQLSIEILDGVTVSLRNLDHFIIREASRVVESIVIGSDVTLNKTLIIRWSL